MTVPASMVMARRCGRISPSICAPTSAKSGMRATMPKVITKLRWRTTSANDVPMMATGSAIIRMPEIMVKPPTMRPSTVLGTTSP